MKYFALILVLFTGQAAFADLTIRHTIEFKFGAFLPPAAIESLKAPLTEQLAKGAVVQIKGKKVLTTMGRIVLLADYASGAITLMDPMTQRYATAPRGEYADKIAAVQKSRMPVMPEQLQQMFANIKLDAKSDRTGKTADIQGIHAEENLLTLSIEIPNPSGVPMVMRMEMHQWNPTAEEVNRLPALKEYEIYASLPKDGVDPTEMMSRSLATFPGLADKIRGSMGELSKNAKRVSLRAETGIFMPSMAAMMGGAAADQPMMQMVMDLSEFSTAPLADSVFVVPANYQPAPLEDLIGVLFPAPKLPAPAAGEPKAQLPAGERPAILNPLPPGVYRVGGGVSAPALFEKTEPTYTEEARAAKISGAVLLGLVVGVDGVPQQMKVLRSLDPGLDVKAMEAVAQWKFKPGLKDGQPVPVQAQIEVNFRMK